MAKQHKLLGEKAPDVALFNQDGETTRLSSFIGKKPVVLFFYPKDESYGCTKEVCSFRDSYDIFRDAGAEVIGVSADSVKRHKLFATNRSLQFTLLSDPKGEARKAYNVRNDLLLFPGRSTFLIDGEGTVRDVFSSQTDFHGHVKRAVQFVTNELTANGGGENAAQNVSVNA